MKKKWTSVQVIKLLNYCIVTCVLAGCFWSPEQDLKACRYKFKAIDFQSVDASQTHWKLGISVFNPNKRPVSLTRMNFSLLHLNDTLLSGINPTQRIVAPGDSQIILTDLNVPNAVWKRLPSSLWTDPAAEFTVTAGAFLDTWVGPIEVPGALRQTIHINMPEQMTRIRDIFLQKMFSWPQKNP